MTKEEWLCLLIFLALFLFPYSPHGYPGKVKSEYPAMVNSEYNVQGDLELLSGKFLQEPQVMPDCINFCSANDLSNWRVIENVTHPRSDSECFYLLHVWWDRIERGCLKLSYRLCGFLEWFHDPTKHVFFSFQFNHPVIFLIFRWQCRWEMSATCILCMFLKGE